MRTGDKEATNRYFRARLYAQGFTIVCVCAGAIYYQEDRQKRKHYQGLLGEKRAREKKEAWIRELEARDREEEVERKKRAARKEKMKEKGAAVATAEEKGKESPSPMDEGDLRSLLTGSRILGPAMAGWWRRLGD